MSARPDPPAIAIGDEVQHRGSLTGVGVVRAVLWVEGRTAERTGGPRWRVLVAFPQSRATEIGPRGHVVAQHVDALGLRVLGQRRLF